MSKEYYRIEPDPDGYYPAYQLVCFKYVVVKETLRGVWVKLKDSCSGTRKHFILNSSVKKFAYPTKEEAINGFIKRKERQIRILSSQLSDAEDQLELAYDPSAIKDYN